MITDKITQFLCIPLFCGIKYPRHIYIYIYFKCKLAILNKYYVFEKTHYQFKSSLSLNSLILFFEKEDKYIIRLGHFFRLAYVILLIDSITRLRYFFVSNEIF